MEQDRRGQSSVAALLVALTLIAIALRLAAIRSGLPYVFHSDFFQIEQAANLLRQGWFTDSSNYPHALVYAYAGAARIWYALQPLSVALGFAHARLPWTEFVERFADPAVHQVLGRAVSAVAGAMLVPAVYRMARVVSGRGVALAAAGIIAVDPAHVVTDHQVRPHAVVVLLLVLAAPAILRLVLEPAPSRRHAALAGAGVGVAALVFPLGWLELLWSLGLLGLYVRPRRRLFSIGASLVGGFLAVFLPITLLESQRSIARPLPGSHAFDAASTLGLPSRMLGWIDLGRLSATALHWIASSPAVFAAAALFLVIAILRGREDARAPSRVRLCVLFLTFPLIVYLTMGAFVGSHARYSLAATPFLAVLGGELCLARRVRPIGAMAAAAILVLGLLGSLKFVRLLHTIDTRFSVAILLSRLVEKGVTVALQDRLVVDRTLLHHGVLEFPAYGDVTLAGGDVGPRRALQRLGAAIYVRAVGSEWSSGPLARDDLERLGYQPYGIIAPGPARAIYLPDLSDRLWLDLARASRTGPAIEIFATARGRAALDRVIDTSAVENFEGASDARSAVAAVLAQREKVSGEPIGFDAARIDLDGDGVPEEVAGNVDSHSLAVLLALPSDDWRDVGGSRRSAGCTMRLEGRGRPVHGQPVLLMIEGAPAASALWLVASVSSDAAAAPLTMAVLPLASGPSGILALQALWPHDSPAGLTIAIQLFAKDASTFAGFCASNKLVATSPR